MQHNFIQSPNYDARPQGKEGSISCIVLHYTGMKNHDQALQRLCNATAKVSAHYIISESGEITQLVADEDRAWHAGISSWRGMDNVNNFSIGIELTNPGHENGYTDFAEAQINSLIPLLKLLSEKHRIRPADIIGHSDVAPDRKEDPGEKFPWNMLAGQGLSIWPAENFRNSGTGKVIFRPGDESGYIGILQKKFSDFGYKLAVTNNFDAATCKVVTAFRRRFTPNFIHCQWDELAEHMLNQVLQL